MATTGGFDWGSAIGTIGGAVSGILGNSSAKKSANKAAKKQIKYLEKAEARAAAERERGRVAALGLLGNRMDDSASRAILSRAMSERPELLTPSQQIAYNDTSRQVTNNLATSGLRGVGRGGLAVLNDAQGRFRANAYDQNQARSDDAARTLFQDAKDAAATGVNVETGTSAAVANDINNNAARVGNVYGQIGENNAGAALGTANTIGNTIGAIASLSAQGRKYDKQYPSYKTAP